MNGSDGAEWHRVGGASGTADRGQEEGGFDDRQGDLALPELRDEVQVEAAQAAWRVGQPEIKIDQSLAISLPVSEHAVSLGILASCEPRFRVRFPERGRKCPRSG